MIPGSRLASCWWPWPQAIDQAQGFPKQVPRRSNLGQLGREIATMADNLGSNQGRLFPQRGSRPVLDFLRQRKHGRDVAEIVGQRMKLEPVGIVANLSAWSVA